MSAASSRLRAALLRWRLNLFPCYFFTGARITRISPDLLEVDVALPLSWRTRNVVGTLFGGFLYAAVDPIFMMILRMGLGEEFVVWDKAALVRFRRPGRGTVRGFFRLTAEELASVRTECLEKGFTERIYPARLVDAAGNVVAEVEKTLWASTRAYYLETKLKGKTSA